MRPDDEAEREQDGGVQLLNNRVAAGKESAGEVQRKRRVRVEVIPLDEIADRADEDGVDAPPDVVEVQLTVVDGRRPHACVRWHARSPGSTLGDGQVPSGRAMLPESARPSGRFAHSLWSSREARSTGTSTVARLSAHCSCRTTLA